ncbi:MAG: hypothetical protein AAF533_16450 [Acidobacteriota bacterium]
MLSLAIAFPGTLFGLIGWIWLTVVGFRQGGWLWGLLALLGPLTFHLLSVLVAIKLWPATKRPVFFLLASFLLSFVFFFVARTTVGPGPTGPTP